MVKVTSSRRRQCLYPFTMLFMEEYSEVEFFRHLSNPLFRRPEFQKYSDYVGNFFSGNVQNLIYISKMQRKILKKTFVFEIIVSELVALNCL